MYSRLLFYKKKDQVIQAVTFSSPVGGHLTFPKGSHELTIPKRPPAELPGSTLPETNIAPQDGRLEYYFPIGEAYFQGLC